MITRTIITDTFYVGVNDRRIELFENMLPMTSGVSYNSYLILDEKAALIDTVELGFSEIFIEKIQAALQGRTLDYLIINHMEPDHSGSIRQIKRLYPDIQIVGNARTFDMVSGYYGIQENLMEVKDNDTLSLGKHQLRFYLTPMLHWPETMMTYDETTQALFSGDAFGTFGALDGGIIDTELDANRYWDEMIRYYANIVGKYGVPVQKALEKLAPLQIQLICSTHGPIWKENISKVIDITSKMSRYEAEKGIVIVYGSMYGHTEHMADTLATYLSQKGIKNIIVHNISRTDSSFILRDIFKYKGLIIGSPTYSNELFPEIDSLLKKIEVHAVKDRIFGTFGSFTWAGTAVKRLNSFGQTMNWTICGAAVEEKQTLKPEQYADLEAMASEFVNLLNA
jgi:flavorubredoxin